MNKNIPDDYVAMAEHICPICGVKHTHDTEILIHKNLRSIPKDQRVTGWGLCEEHDKLHKDGFVALVATKPPATGDTLKIKDAIRTGDIAHLRRTAAADIFGRDFPMDLPMVFVELEVITMLKSMAGE